MSDKYQLTDPYSRLTRHQLIDKCHDQGQAISKLEAQTSKEPEVLSHYIRAHYEELNAEIEQLRSTLGNLLAFIEGEAPSLAEENVNVLEAHEVLSSVSDTFKHAPDCRDKNSCARHDRCMYIGCSGSSVNDTSKETSK